MEPNFWHDRWQKNSIGFHQPEINPQLKQFWPQLKLPPGSTVFVPLCGKSRDMLWLKEAGHEVIGVELSPIAARDFYAENKIEAKTSTRGKFEQWEGSGITILVGDFFALQASHLTGVAGAYDRASLIALPLDLRQKYAAHLAAILPKKSAILLVTLEYPEEEMQGPPFSVTETEVRRLFEKFYRIDPLKAKDALAENPPLRERGLTALTERSYRLTPA